MQAHREHAQRQQTETKVKPKGNGTGKGQHCLLHYCTIRTIRHIKAPYRNVVLNESI